MERKSFKFAVKDVNEEEGVIEGYGSTFIKEPDSYGDIVDEGAFTKTIKENADTIVSLFNHQISEPIGKPALSVDKKGLLAKITIVRGVRKAEETLLLAKAGVLTRMSIGYNTIKDSWDGKIRHIQEVRLYDVSPVVFAANEDATITAVKFDARAWLDNALEGILEQVDEEGNLIKTGRVLSAASIEKLRSAIDALQALYESAISEEEPEKSTLLAQADQEAAQLEGIVGALKASNEGFDTRKAESRIEAILTGMRK